MFPYNPEITAIAILATNDKYGITDPITISAIIILKLKTVKYILFLIICISSIQDIEKYI